MPIRADKAVEDRMIDFNTPLDGMLRAAGRLDAAAARIAHAPSPATNPPDSIDLSAEMISVLQARNQFQANVRTALAGDEMVREALDLLG